MAALLILSLPIALQSVAMIFDEFHFHRKRGLPKWERIGHPVDTCLVLATVCVPVFFEFRVESALSFAALAFLSSLVVTKDEFVHSVECEPAENWLHSLLFVLHPLVFVSIVCLWMERDAHLIASFFEVAPLAHERNAIVVYAAVTSIFMVYQTVYWNFVWKEK